MTSCWTTPVCWLVNPVRDHAGRTITPGETSMADALTILESLDGIQVLSANDNLIFFAGDSGQPCCQIISYDKVNVEAVLLQFAPRMTLAGVIQAYGEPTFVTGQPFSEAESMMVMIYPERTMLLYVVVDAIDGALEGASPVIGALTLTETEVDQMLSQSPMDNWKGFLSYDAYMDGEFDNNP